MRRYRVHHTDGCETEHESQHDPRVLEDGVLVIDGAAIFATGQWKLVETLTVEREEVTA